LTNYPNLVTQAVSLRRKLTVCVQKTQKLGHYPLSLFSAYISAPAPNLIYNAKLGPVDEKGAP